MPPAKAIVKLAIPATLALLAKAVYNLVDTAYIGMLNSDIALTAVGVTVPLLLIMVSVENIFAAGAAALANLPAQSMNCAARAESSVKISSIAVITGAALNILLDPVFMFDWGLSLGSVAADIPDGAVPRLRSVLYDDHHLSDHWVFPVWAVPLCNTAGAVLYPLHFDPAETAGRCWHLCVPTRCGYPDCTGLRC